MAEHDFTERQLTAPEGLLVSPVGGGTGAGVLVLSGSSGRIERDRARVLARAGATALTYRWFGDDGRPPAIHGFPLESFDWAVDLLAGQCDRVVLMGVSKSATVVAHPDAGHRVILPGEEPATGGRPMARGGTEAGDRTLGRLAWPEILRILEAA